MGGSSNTVTNTVNKAKQIATDALGNTLTDALGNPIDAVTGGSLGVPTKGGKVGFTVRPKDAVNADIANAQTSISNAQGSVQNAPNIPSQMINDAKAAPSKVQNAYQNDPLAPKIGNFIEEQYKDITGNLKPKLPKFGQNPLDSTVGITEIGGRRKRKMRGASEIRSGLAATMLSKPSSLLGNSGLSQNMGKAKLGQ